MTNIVKLLCLGIILLNTSTFGLHAFGSAIGELFSMLIFGMPIVYGILKKKMFVLKIFIALGLGYYLLSGIQFYRGIDTFYFRDFIKFIALVLFGGEIVKNTSKTELFIFLLIGAGTVILNAIFFTDNYGRYSGFYLDPNAAGFICITGYGLTYGLNQGKLKLFGQFVFSLAGFMTFSRTFIILWVLINLLSLKLSLKNLKIFFIGAIVVVLLISFSAALQLNTVRLNQLKALVTNEKVSTQELNEDSRLDTWARFYNFIYDKPLFGNGFGSFQGGGLGRIGPHNTFLLLIGEAGIIPFLIFFGLQFYILYYGYLKFMEKPYLLMMGIGQFLFLLTNHNFFTAYYLILIVMWIYGNIKMTKNEN